MSAQSIIRGMVSRILPQADPDGANQDSEVRVGRYGDLYSIPIVRKQHALADEGTYFVTNNAQTGVATGASATFINTAPFLQVANTDSQSNSSAKRIYLDYLALITTVAGGWVSAGVNIQAVVQLDTGDRYTSGGTDLSASIVNVNMDVGARASVAKVRAGALLVPAPTGTVRTICGLRIVRPAASATVADVIGETKLFNFGSVENTMNGSIVVANANNIPIPVPPLVIGPGQCALIYLILNGTTPSAVSYAPELGWWER